MLNLNSGLGDLAWPLFKLRKRVGILPGLLMSASETEKPSLQLTTYLAYQELYPALSEANLMCFNRALTMRLVSKFISCKLCILTPKKHKNYPYKVQKKDLF